MLHPPVDEARRTTDLTSHERISKDAFFRRFLPLDVSVRKGAFLVGNPDLPTVLTGHFESARGVYRAVASSSEKDYYRVRHDMELHSVKVSMRHNVDYRARTVAETLQPKQTEAPKSRYTVKDRLVRLVFGVTPTAKSKSIPLTTKAEGWSGLSRYQDAEEPLPHQQRLREEYARVSDVLVGKRLVINHYMDVAGPNVVEPSSPGRTAPEWGAKLTLVEGLFQYGAWSDRQRAILQRYFYPPTFRTQQKTDVAASATRLHSEFKLAILVEGEVTWRVPTQEPSKDWRFPKEGLAEIQISTAPRTLTRPYGWIDLKCSGASRINWTLPLLNQDDGYVSTVALRFENAFLSTSVNYSTFISAPLVKVDFTMPGPLQWNAYRKWNIDISFEEANLWLLRDHITLLSDVVRDWTAGPPSDPAFFIPIDYAFNIVFDRYRLHLCANEGNVIDQPNSLGDNIYFVLRGPRIAWGIVLPFGQQDPPEHSYNMDIRCQDLTVDLLFPPSNTIGAYLSEASSNIGFLRSFDVDICWTIRREHSPIKSDVITMDMRATHARMALFGFLPRYAVWLKENYVGPNTSYVTVDEYRVVAANPAAAQKLRSMQEAAIPPSNPTDLRISLEVEEATVLLPHQIYGGEDVSILKTRSLMLDNRNFEHYQDMMLSCSPISVTEGKASTAELNLPNPSTTNHLSIEDLVVRGHRIFGPQPTNTVYAVDWRIHIANVTGVALPPFLSRLGSAIQAFRKTFLDYDNLNVPYPELFDVTSIEFAVDYVNLAIWGDGSVSSIELEKGITLCTDDWATEKATRRLALDLPSLSISLKSYSENVTTGESWSADRIDFAPWVEVARFQTGVHVQAWIRGPHWESFSRKQRRFLVLQDARTRRAVFYYEDHPDEPFTEADANVISQDYFLPPFHPPMMSHAGGASHMERRRSLSTFSLHRAKANATDLSTSIRSVVAPDEIGSIISHSDDEESATSVQDGASIHIIDGEDEGSSSPTSEDAASPLGWTEAYSTSPLHEPPPSRSIPYKSYLRRFQLALARGSTNPNSGIRFVYVVSTWQVPRCITVVLIAFVLLFCRGMTRSKGSTRWMWHFVHTLRSATYWSDSLPMGAERFLAKLATRSSCSLLKLAK